MISKRLSIYGFISAAALVSGVVAGCGGSSSTTGTQTQVPTSGGSVPIVGTSPTAVPSSPAPQPGQQVQVSVNGTPTSITGTLPANESIPTNGVVAVIPNPATPNSPILGNASSAIVRKTTKAPSAIGGSTAPGEVWVDNCDTGVLLNQDGTFPINNGSGFLLIAPGVHTMTIYGPWTIGSGSDMLTVQTFNFGFTVLADGNASFPSVISGKLPGNGGETYAGNSVKCSYTPLSDFAVGFGQLVLVWPGVTKTQTRSIVNGQVTFSDPLADSTDKVPAGGVTSVTYNWTPSP
jgi:hypothetical protein